MLPTAALHFANQLRNARDSAIKDGEAFDAVIHVVERLGSFLLTKIGDLGKYEDELAKICQESEISVGITPFRTLYQLVRDARNDALHQGAFARHLTLHSIELALRLEDALRMGLDFRVENYMVRNPVCAELWQPISFIRQQMLANSFSCLPVRTKDGEWQILTDADLVQHLRAPSDERKRRMAQRLQDTGIKLTSASCVSEDAELDQAVALVAHGPVLVHHKDDTKFLVGILTAFDLL